MVDELNIIRLVVGYLSANCWIVGKPDTGNGLVIDPGGNAEDIYRTIKKLDYDIQTIVLTHGHSDHIAALFDIQEKTNAQVAIHIEDVDFLEGRGAFSSQFGISYKTPDTPDMLLREGDAIMLDDISFTVLHTPGHTPGSICLQTATGIFTGDTLFYRGIGTTLMPGSSRRQLLESIHTRLMVLPDDTRLFPGHGRETTIGAERANNRAIRNW